MAKKRLPRKVNILGHKVPWMGLGHPDWKEDERTFTVKVKAGDETHTGFITSEEIAQILTGDRPALGGFTVEAKEVL